MDMDSPIDTTPILFTTIPCSMTFPSSLDQNKCQCHIADDDGETESNRLPPYLRNFTSLKAWQFVDFMNRIGWPRDGTFVAFLSAMGYYFRKENGRIVTRKEGWQVEGALSIAIFEL